MELREEKIVEVIKEGEIVKMPESKAVEEDLFILRRIIEPEKDVEPLRERILRKDSTQESDFKSKFRIDEWKRGRFGVQQNNVVRDLIDNFHWEVSKARRFKNLTRRQLAEAIDVPEDEIKLVEFGDLPRDDFVLISKLENYLGVSLRKERKSEGVSLADLQKMNESKIQEEIKKVHLKEAKDSRSEGSGISGNDIEILE